MTSATIDADRFAQHFASRHGPAPVIQVSGRLFPVEQRWRPFENRANTVSTTPSAKPSTSCGREGAGDVLVFLPGEREIREAADHLRKHHPPASRSRRSSRLSRQEQDRVFEPHGAPRIVLATNVAETSLTVPGIRYVIDAGTARVKRYSYRNKVEQLQIEPVSQAAATSAPARCGRVSNGICVRLYDERISPAAALHRPGDPALLAGRRDPAHEVARPGQRRGTSPSSEPPRRAIADGYQLLSELGAVDELNQLTPIGRELAKAAAGPARRPHDPRGARSWRSPRC